MRAALLVLISLEAVSSQPLPAPAPGQDSAGAIELPFFYVRDFRFSGNTAFSDGELWMVVAEWVREEVTSADLERARQALTLHYVNSGYISSGVLLEDQTVRDGLITFTVVEGELSDVQVTGTRRLSKGLVRHGLRGRVQKPLSLPELQESLLLLRQNPNIERLNAELKPGPRPGQSLLHLAISEANPWQAGLVFRNDRPPSIGAETLEVFAAHGNVAGFSDQLALRYSVLRRARDGVEFPGLEDWDVSYSLPISPYDTTLLLFYDRDDFTIIEEPFAELDVSSESSNYGATLRHPLVRSINREVALGLTLERRRTLTFLLGEPFSFSPGAEDGRSAVTVLRFFQEWVARDHQRVLALRSTFSWGLDWFHPTKRESDPDGLFAAWLGQAQYIRRLGESQHQLVLNSTLQLANEPLLSLEQFSIGGANTVRGYRENQIVRDMGWLASAELRLALWLSGRGDPLFQIAPFADFGLGWNARSPTPEPSDIASAGLGLIFTPHRKIEAKLYWGYGFREFDPAEKDPQDYGLHFHLTARAL